MPKTEIRLVVFSCAWKQARSWIFPEACKVFQKVHPTLSTKFFPCRCFVKIEQEQEKLPAHVSLWYFERWVFLFTHCTAEEDGTIRWVPEGFFLLFAAKPRSWQARKKTRSSRSRLRRSIFAANNREKNPLAPRVLVRVPNEHSSLF